MGWATHYIARLRQGETVQFRPRGQSMRGKIKSGELCTVAPLTGTTSIAVGDIVLCTVRGVQYLHLVKSMRGDEVQIGNNIGRINGWTAMKNIYGRLIAVEP